MQAWLAKVLVIKDSVEFVKWNEEKVLPYEIKDYVESLKWNEEKELSYERKNSVEFLKLKWNE